MLIKRGKAGGIGIVFLHGFGANAADLYPLAEELAPGTTDESWYFPDAPLEVPIGPHVVGRAWFPVPSRDLENSIDYSNVTPPGLEKAVNHVAALLKTLPHEKLIIGGFSQGAMIATQVVLSHPEKFKGLVILSGALVHAGVWRKLATQSPPLEFFQSHGTADPVLPFTGAEKLNELLVECGWSGRLIGFRGGHEIPMPVLRDLRSYLRARVAD